MKDSIFAAVYNSTKGDPYLLGGHIGSFTTVVYLAIDYLASLVFKSNTVPHYSAMLMLSRAAHGAEILYGVLADLVAGTLLGFVTIFLLERTNYKNLVLKGLVAGSVLWIMHVSLIPSLWNPELLPSLTRATVTVSFFTHGFWGAFCGFILDRFLKSSTLPRDIKESTR